MNAKELLRTVVFPALKKIIPGIGKIEIPGLPGMWFSVYQSSVCYCIMDNSDGTFTLSVAMSNIYTPNEKHVFEAIDEMIDFIAENAAKFAAIPVEGRMIGRAQYLEETLGTLAGLDMKKELAAIPEDEVFDDAITEPANREFSL